jgi:non-lysosomal glucosylceramidase
MKNLIPAQAWTRRFDEQVENPGKPSLAIPLPLMMKMLPILVRMYKNTKMFEKSGIHSINMFHTPKPGPVMGVPLGGIGGGSINRGWRGDFRRWTIRPGFIDHQVVDADQFSLRVQRESEPAQAIVLSVQKPQEKSLSSWNWNMDPTCGTYHALFPRAWTSYTGPLPGIRLSCKQVSPVIPNNYKESSYPVTVFEWTVENTESSPADVSLMFTWQNGMGIDNDSAGGHWNSSFKRILPNGNIATGMQLHHVHRQDKTLPLGMEKMEKLETIEDPLVFAIGARASKDFLVTTQARFETQGDGSDIWNGFVEKGKLDNRKNIHISTQGEKIGAAVAVSGKLKAKSSAKIVFALAWDMPRFHTGVGREYFRRYTIFLGKKGNAAPALVTEALINYPAWERKIEVWQKPILNDKKLPDWYKATLMNELYYIVEGGTLWAYPGKEKPDPNKMGHFSYLEGHEYRMMNTFDVHYYASIAMIKLWPRIELSIQRDFADATLCEIPEELPMVFEKGFAPRKVRGAVPHDLGWPEEDPWFQVNGYNFHDSSKWKDLNPKFVLQVYRDYVYTGDRTFLKYCWQAVHVAMEFMWKYDRDGDGVIENDGFPDQTYDAWSVKGISTYTGGLWLAALEAAAKMAHAVGENQVAKKYFDLFEKGRKTYVDTLWNGSYLNYDCSKSGHQDSVMADQFAGQEFTYQCGLEPILDSTRTRTALKTIFEKNVMGVLNGSIGAMNGVRRDGRIDKSSIQSQEVWAGTTYMLAATMITEGLIKEAFRTAEGIYKVTYINKGYWFSTPEAWTEKGDYRALTYMRPLAIWAMQDAWERASRKSKKNDR